MCDLVNLLNIEMNVFKADTMQNVNWTYVRRSKDVHNVFWTSSVRLIYVLCPVERTTSLQDVLLFSLLIMENSARELALMPIHSRSKQIHVQSYKWNQ